MTRGILCVSMNSIRFISIALFTIWFVATSTVLVLSQASGTWTATGTLNFPRVGHTATLLANGQVLVAVGQGTTGNLITSAELYSPSTGKWTTTGSMTVPRGNHTATLLSNGKVLVEGGLCSGGFIYPDPSAELYDASTGTWTATDSMNFARASAGATLLQSGEVLVAGGNGTSVAGRSAELYNASKGQWTVIGSMSTPRGTLQMVLLSNGDALVLGGTDLPLMRASTTCRPTVPGTQSSTTCLPPGGVTR